MNGWAKVLEQDMLSVACQNMKKIALAVFSWQFWQEETVINAGTNLKSDFSTASDDFTDLIPLLHEVKKSGKDTVHIIPNNKTPPIITGSGNTLKVALFLVWLFLCVVT